MIVRHFNTDLNGGAATAARRLHLGLRQRQVDSRFHYSTEYVSQSSNLAEASSYTPISHETEQRSKAPSRRQHRRYCRDFEQHLRNRPIERELFSLPWQLHTTPFGRPDWSSSIVHLHWISFWIDQDSFFKSLPRRQPVVWTLHDMEALTGGCHHADECENFHSQCQSCPQLDDAGKRDLSQRSFLYKKKVYRRQNLHIVTPSRWLERQSRSSKLMDNVASIQTIRNGLDFSQYRPIDKSDARRRLGISPHGLVVGFGAASLANVRKGFQDFVQGLQHWSASTSSSHPSCSTDTRASSPTLTVLTFGDQETEMPTVERVEFTSVGYLHTIEEQVLAYSAMDLFVLPSWAENMPQTAIESLACATPVLAYDIGGVPEIVIPHKTGMLSRHRDPADLAKRLREMLAQPDACRQWGLNGRELVRDEFSIDASCQRYLALYQSIGQESKAESKGAIP